MLTRRGLTLALVGALTIAGARLTIADERPKRLKSAAQCRTEGGSELVLPPGVHYSTTLHDRLDAEFRRLQEQETRLAAENKALRGLTRDYFGRTLKILGTGIAIGIAAGAGAAYYYEHR